MSHVQPNGRSCPVKLAGSRRAAWRVQLIAVAIGAAGILCCIGNAATATTPSERSGGTISIYSVGSASGNSQTVVITGAFADAGSLTVTGPISKVVLSRGTIMINLAKGIAAENKLFNNVGKFVSQATCGINASYSAPVTFVSGTGAYVGIRGAAALKTAELGVFPRLANGKCNLSENAQPIGFLSLGLGSGVVHFKST
jgi:hypothetical protein